MSKETVTTPRRVQRKRTRGWRMPRNTVYVGSPSIFANPFIGHNAAFNFDKWLEGKISLKEFMKMERRPFILHHDRERILDGIPNLKGKHLACWCTLDQFETCHADVLLRRANG